MGSLKVTVITINFNGARSLEKTILSVLEQSYPNIEYIIIDGGSTNGSLPIIKKYETKIARWISEPDGGVSDAFNKGIALASGEWIGILNSDDWYEKQALENMVLAAQKNPAAEVIHGNLQIWNQDKKGMYISPDDHLKNIEVDMIFNHPASFVKKSAYQKYGVFETGYKRAMDYDLFLRFYKHGAQFFHLNFWVANMNLGGISDRHWVKASQEVLRSQLHHTDSKIKPYLIFCYRILRTGLRMGLEKIGFNSVVIFYRNCQKRKQYVK